MADLTEVTYIEGSLLPDLWVAWRDFAGRLIPFATDPHDFEMTVTNRKTSDMIEFTKSTGFTGYDSNPNLQGEWENPEIDVLDPGIYDGTITATRQSDSKPRQMPITIRIRRRPGSGIDPGSGDPPD